MTPKRSSLRINLKSPDISIKQISKTKARTARYFEKLKHDPDRWEVFKKENAERASYYRRKKKTNEQMQKIRDLSKIRSRNYRARQKEKIACGEIKIKLTRPRPKAIKKIETWAELKEKRKKWKEYKRKQRMNQTKEQQRHEREKNALIRSLSRKNKGSSNKDKQKIIKEDHSARNKYLKETRVKRIRKIAEEEEIISLNPSSVCKRLEPGHPANENDKNCRSSIEDFRLAADLSNKEVQIESIYEDFDFENKNACCSVNNPNSNVNPPLVSSSLIIINNSTVPDTQDPPWKMDTRSILSVVKQEPTFDLYTSPDLSANEPSCELKITSLQSIIEQEPCDLDNALKLNNNAQVEFQMDNSDLRVEVYDKKKLLSSAENFNRHFVHENIECISTNLSILSEQKSELLNFKQGETFNFNLSGNECVNNGINLSEIVMKQEVTEMPSSLVEHIETAATSSYGLQVSLEENEISLPNILQKRTLKSTERIKVHLEKLKKNTEIFEAKKKGTKKRQKLLVKNKFSQVHSWEKNLQENKKRKLPGLIKTSLETEKISEKVRKPQTEQQIIKCQYKKAKMTNLYEDNETGNAQTFNKSSGTAFTTKKARQQAILRVHKQLPSDPQQIVEVIWHIIKTAKPQTKKMFAARGIVCG